MLGELSAAQLGNLSSVISVADLATRLKRTHPRLGEGVDATLKAILERAEGDLGLCNLTERLVDDAERVALPLRALDLYRLKRVGVALTDHRVKAVVGQLNRAIHNSVVIELCRGA